LKIQNIVKSPTRKQLIGPDKVRGKKGRKRKHAEGCKLREIGCSGLIDDFLLLVMAWLC
jgi:hypothetical protein